MYFQGPIVLSDLFCGAVNQTRFLHNGANRIQCVDSDASGLCDGTEFVWVYDAYGNLLDDGSSQYTYDAALRLKTVTTGGSTTSYTYNGDGDRVAQTVNGVQTAYVIDMATPLTMVLAETTGTSTIRYLHGLDLVAQSDGTSTEYFAYDGLGSVRQVLDAAGLPLLTQTFDPYGNPYASTGINESNWGYTGEYQDSNGLVFLRARYYNPAQGRFGQMDPSRRENNPYRYAAANPINFTDPSGEKPSCWPDNTSEVCQDYPASKPYIANTGSQNTGNYNPYSPPSYLRFEPSIQFSGVKGISSQFTVSGYPPGSTSDGKKEWYDLCGTISVAWIVQELGDKRSAQEIVQELELEVSTDVAKGPVLIEALERLARNRLGYKTAWGHEYEWETDYDRYFSMGVRPHLDGTQWPIILLYIQNVGHPNYKAVNNVTSILHFVVITGLSAPDQWAKGRGCIRSLGQKE